MFRLYDAIFYKMIGEPTSNEIDLINTMGNLFSEDINYRFLIIKRENGGDFPYKAIRSVDDYAEYLQEYKMKQEIQLEKETVMQLKRDIIDLSNKKQKVR